MPNGNPAPGPLNSRYFRPVRGKETRARRWDRQFESTSLQRGVRNELLIDAAPFCGVGFTEVIRVSPERCFAQCLAVMPTDGPATVFHRRIKLLRGKTLPTDWDGVWQLTDK
jgi:hypothetical protein